MNDDRHRTTSALLASLAAAPSGSEPPRVSLLSTLAALFEAAGRSGWTLLRYAVGTGKPQPPAPATVTAYPPGLSVVIVTWNGQSLVEALLETLARQTRQPDEIILVDNGSTDDTAAAVRARRPAVTVIALPENRGFAAAANAGLRAARFATICLLNNDLELEPGFLAALTAALDRHPEAGSVAPLLVAYADRAIIHSAGDYLTAGLLPANRFAGRRRDALALRDEEVWGATAAAVLYRKAMLDQLGYFDERFLMTYEDTDLSWRARRAGWRCRFAPAAVAAHHHLATIGKGSAVNAYCTVKNRFHPAAKNLSRRGILVRSPLIWWAHTRLLAGYLRRDRTRAAARAGWRQGMADLEWLGAGARDTRE